ncbi:hypothetical protein SUGI_0544450 [Cryptomeria japonica]|nr:hypothetical protein SUGI_0544450 [Cryptomeria japonica]
MLEKTATPFRTKLMIVGVSAYLQDIDHSQNHQETLQKTATPFRTKIMIAGRFGILSLRISLACTHVQSGGHSQHVRGQTCHIDDIYLLDK